MKLAIGDTAPTVTARTILGKPVQIPDCHSRWLHLQFRRFAGCPVCNFHLLTMSKRHAEIEAAGIHQVVFFHSSQEEMLNYQAQLPFDCIADVGKKYYLAFGVESSGLALLNPRILWSGARWIVGSRRLYKKAENGVLGLPADFLLDSNGDVAACKYGTNADDQWDTDELLEHARMASVVTTPATGASSVAVG